MHVQEGQVSDRARRRDVVSELAEQISDNMVFPGQIKVTVIRELTAVAIAN